MHYRITGADKGTGKDVDVTVEATNVAGAELYAQQKRILITDVQQVASPQVASPQVASRRISASQWKIILIFAAVGLSVFAGNALVKNSDDPRREQAERDKEQAKEKTELDARVAAYVDGAEGRKAEEAQTFVHSLVLGLLKSPASAKFSEEECHPVGTIHNHLYRVHGFVDSQNGFGAMLRTEYTVTVFKAFDGWRVDDQQITTR